MTQPIELIVEEPMPGNFVWRLLETDGQGENARVLRSAYDAADTYESALASGQAALNSEIRQRSKHASPQHG